MWLGGPIGVGARSKGKLRLNWCQGTELRLCSYSECTAPTWLSHSESILSTVPQFPYMPIRWHFSSGTGHLGGGGGLMHRVHSCVQVEAGFCSFGVWGRKATWSTALPWAMSRRVCLRSPHPPLPAVMILQLADIRVVAWAGTLRPLTRQPIMMLLLIHPWNPASSPSGAARPSSPEGAGGRSP